MLPGCGDDEKVTPGDAGKSAADIPGVDLGVALYKCSNPGKPCNAHNPCAIDPICGQDGWCRPTSVQSCDDGLACTVDTCKGQGLCSNIVKAGSCKLAVRVPKGTTCAGLTADAGLAADAGLVGDAGEGDGGAASGGKETIFCCFTVGDPSPVDPCKRCSPPSGAADGGSATSWSPSSGSACDDGDACTMNDKCSDGVCQGTSYASKCADSFACTSDLCDGKGGCLGNPLKIGQCLIDKKCYKAGDGNPSGSCSTCAPATSQTAWTPLASSCAIGNKCYAKGAKHPGGCAECDPASSQSSWTVKGTTHCLIADKCVAAGTKDPTPGSCSTCQPAKDPAAYSADAGYCKIQGVCLKDGAAHPGGCATCKAKTSATGWTVTTPATDCLLNGKCASWCGAQCVDLASDTKHCGKCNNPCTSGQICLSSKCSAFTPAQVSPGDMVLWLSADKGITAAAGKVTKWADQSGSGLDAVASPGYEPSLVASSATLGKQPALQMKTSFFSCGASKKFDIATPSLFAVTAGSSTGITFTKAFGTPGTGWRRLELNKLSYRAGNDKHAIPHNAVVANPNVFAMVSSSNKSHTVSVNGVAKTSTAQLYHTPFTKAEFKIGGSKPGLSSHDGQIAEIIIYRAALSASDRKKVECYLGSKYGITVAGCP